MEQPSHDIHDDNNSRVSFKSDPWDPNAADSPESNDPPSPILEHDNDNASGELKKPTQPLQKRRRVTRACDECRRKKIKCDGKQPCTHCTVYSYDCTYDQPSNRRRNAQPQYIEALESQLKRAVAVISALLPSANIDLKDPALEAKIQAGMLSHMAMSIAHVPGPVGDTRQQHQPQQIQNGTRGESGRLESMVKATGNLDLDEQGYYDYHGGSSGLSFVRRMREQFGDIMGPEGQATPFLKTRPLSMAFESPKSVESPLTSHSHYQGLDLAELPSKKEALTLCDNAINDAAAAIRFVHVPSFYKSVDRIYELTPDTYAHEDHTFLPLFYSVLATGSLYFKDDMESDKLGYENAIEKGFIYFQASRKLLDITDCRDLPSIQAVLFMIFFLQGSAKLSTCYSYIGVAIRSALRLGLHRSFSSNFNCIEQEVRKRVFWAIRKLDLYVGALIGLPYTLNDEDIDQEFPTEVDDELITAEKIEPQPPNEISVMTVFNHHARLMIILGRIVRRIYPIKGTTSTENGLAGQNYEVSLSAIRDLEAQLQAWEASLPPGLRPGDAASPFVFRCQHIVRFAYAHVSMMLYRPFLHYISDKYRTKEVDQRAYACAVACVSVARNIVHIAVEMKRNQLLVGAYWSTMYSTYFSIMALIFFVLQNPEDSTSQQVLRDAQQGKELLSQLAKQSLAADRCTATLSGLFEQLPEHLRKERAPMSNNRKRPFNPKPAPHSSSQPDLNVTADDTNLFPPRRAATFPENLQDPPARSSHFPPQSAQYQLSHFGSDYLPSPGIPGVFDTPTMTPSSASSMSFARPSSQVQHSPFAGTPTNPGFFNASEYGPPVNDMSALMFPNPDPFAYPTQAMAAFENNAPAQALSNVQQADTDFKQPLNFSNGFTSNSLNTTSLENTANPVLFDSKTAQDNVELFGTVPMYLMQHSSTHEQPFAQNPNPHQFPETPTQSSSMNNDLGPDLIGDEWSMPLMANGTFDYGDYNMGVGYPGWPPKTS